jgi:hypothetical protein
MTSRMSMEKVHAGRELGSGSRRGCGGRHEPGHFLGLDAEALGPKGQVVAALAVILPVVLSGMFFASIGVWWVVTTYGWVAFPAFGLLVRGVAGLSESKAALSSERSTGEKDLLEALRREGELTPTRAAMETSLSVAEADAMLKELAEGGHLEVRVHGGGLFYALWGDGARDETRGLEAR